MKKIELNFKELTKKRSQPCRRATSGLKCNQCLCLIWLYLILFIGVCIAETLASSSAGTVVKVLEGKTATLNCTNKSLSGQVTYDWSHKDGSLIHVQRNLSSLVFPNSNRNLSNTYICRYTLNGSSFNESIKLIIQYPPKVTSVLPSYKNVIKPGENILLSCIVDAVPPVNRIIWKKERNFTDSTNFSISNAKCSDSGEYECFPFNDAGSALGNGSIIVDVKAPSEPVSVAVIASLKCNSDVYVNWSRPLENNGPAEDLQYQVFYKNAESNSSYWSNSNITQWTNYTLTNLNHTSTYHVKVQACYKGTGCCSTYSNVTTVSVKAQATDCGKMKGSTESDSGLNGISLTALVIVVVFLIIVCFVLVVCLKCRSTNSNNLCAMPFKGLFNLEPTANSNLSRVSSYKERREREAIPYERFWNHVILRHADSNYRFSSEFESLQGIIEKNKKLTWIHSQRPENQPKNRFANVVAYDQTRVVLSMMDNVQGSHYINANYVDSYNAMNFYIATQGPLANTIADFWRMVWEQNSRVIIMITNIVEKGRHKCTQYWPTKNRKVQDHGQLRVTFLREEQFAFYTQREFEVRPLKDSTHYIQDATDEAIKPMLVQQFHFTGWPDHGVPDPGYEIPVLDFIFKSTAAQVEGAGPLVVHCSAGVGRSGAYIVIDSMVKRIHDNGDIDVFNFLCHIRQQRNHLVQEECQYIFVHDVLLEYIQCGFLLSLPKKALRDHLNRLRSLVHSGKNKLTAEFERIKSIKIQEYNLKEGQKTCNINKNRNTNIIPVDSCCVKLYPRPGEEGSDYINASYIDGFWRREAYIATQYPLESTIFDFWRMIWQENCRTMVMLTSKEELDQTNTYPRYLPVVHDTARFGVYEVTMETETARGDLMIRDLKMTSLNEPGETRRIRHFHFLHWPAASHPWSGQSLLQLISKVDEWEKNVKSKSKPFDMIGPIVVHCSTGVGRTGVYCMLHTLWHQVEREEVVSVYPYARLYFHQRLEFLLTQAQYEFVYDTIVEYIEADCSLYLV